MVGITCSKFPLLNSSPVVCVLHEQNQSACRCEGHHKVITANVNKMAKRLEGNVRDYAGRGNVTVGGRYGMGWVHWSFFMASEWQMKTFLFTAQNVKNPVFSEPHCRVLHI
jgi:hypothetical protein